MLNAEKGQNSEPRHSLSATSSRNRPGHAGGDTSNPDTTLTAAYLSRTSLSIPWADQRAIANQNKERCSNIIGTAHALVINSLFWLVTSDSLFRSSIGRRPLPIGKRPQGDSAA